MLMRLLDSAQAILAVKNLGKHPLGSQCISSQSNISILLQLSSLKDLEASNEALRCIANSMLLIESARETFVQTDVGGRAAATELLEVSIDPDNLVGGGNFRIDDKYPRRNLLRQIGYSSHREYCSWPRFPHRPLRPSSVHWWKTRSLIRRPCSTSLVQSLTSLALGSWEARRWLARP